MHKRSYLCEIDSHSQAPQWHSLLTDLLAGISILSCYMMLRERLVGRQKVHKTHWTSRGQALLPQNFDFLGGLAAA